MFSVYSCWLRFTSSIFLISCDIFFLSNTLKSLINFSLLLVLLMEGPTDVKSAVCERHFGNLTLSVDLKSLSGSLTQITLQNFEQPLSLIS